MNILVELCLRLCLWGRGILVRYFMTFMLATILAFPVSAHHSDAGIDLNSLVTLEGTITGFYWRWVLQSPPHAEAGRATLFPPVIELRSRPIRLRTAIPMAFLAAVRDLSKEQGRLSSQRDSTRRKPQLPHRVLRAIG